MRFIKDPKNWIILSLIIICLWLFPWGGRPEHQHIEPTNQPTTVVSDQVWTCSMHPQIRRSEPGLCPVCNMNLIPANDSGDEATGEWELVLSEHARKLAEIRTTAVKRSFTPHEVSMVGKVTYDEKRLGVISAWVPGRIDRLFVDFTGIEVKKGDHMVSLYSPELVTAQQELRQALHTLQTGSESLKSATLRRVEATREKLRLLGLSSEQVGAIEEAEIASDF